MYWLFISHLCLNDGFNCIYEYVVLIVSVVLAHIERPDEQVGIKTHHGGGFI